MTTMRNRGPQIFKGDKYELLIGSIGPNGLGIPDQVKIKPSSNTGVSDPSNDMLPLIGACSVMYNGNLYMIGGTGSTQIIEITGCMTRQRGVLILPDGQKAIQDAVCTSANKRKPTKSQKFSEELSRNSLKALSLKALKHH